MITLTKAHALAVLLFCHFKSSRFGRKEVHIDHTLQMAAQVPEQTNKKKTTAAFHCVSCVSLAAEASCLMFNILDKWDIEYLQSSPARQNQSSDMNLS